MTRELPARPSLEHLKAQAKDLLEQARSAAPGALQRFRDGLPAAHGASVERLLQMGLALHDAQSVIAREYGFASWSELKAAVERSGASASLTPAALRALLERVTKSPPPAEVQQALLEVSNAPAPELSLPAELPLVPLRNTVLSVGAVAPIMIGRAASLAAVDAARQGSQLLALLSQRDELDENPGAAALHPVGCVAALHGSFPAPEGSWLVVRALAWVRLMRLTSERPYLRANVERFEVQQQLTDEARQLEQQLRERVRNYVATLPDSDRMQRRVDGMSPLQLADTTLANLKCSVDAKAGYAAEADLTGRLRRVLELFDQGA